MSVVINNYTCRHFEHVQVMTPPLAETAKAYKFEAFLTKGLGRNRVSTTENLWFPKSQINIDKSQSPDYWIIAVPLWLWEQKCKPFLSN